MQESCDAQQDVGLTEEQIEEINLHKYYLSERAGHDVGWDHAVSDWKQTSEKASGDEPQAASQSEPPVESVQATTEAAATEKPKNRIGGFFKRLLSKAAMM